MTVFVYVNTSKPAGDVDHIKVFANQAAAETCSPSPRPLPVKKNGERENSQPQSITWTIFCCCGSTSTTSSPMAR
jgi:hypothetical protein